MGCCISICREKNELKCKENSAILQDKLVIISQTPTSSTTTHPITKYTYASSTNTSLPQSSCTCSQGSTISSSSSSSLSTASSTLSSKERPSFSNEFLWSCVKENPHIIRIDLPKQSPKNPNHPKIDHAQKMRSPLARQAIPQRLVRPSPPQKRACPNSPTLTRKKSFRREQNSIYSNPNRPSMRSPSPSREQNSTYFNTNSPIMRSPSPASREQNSTYSNTNRPIMRSPSPSRRFNNGKNLKNVVAPKNMAKETCNKRSNATSMRMDHVRTPSRHWRSVKDRNATCNYLIGSSKVDEIGDGEVVSNMEIDSLHVDDINNPHISLDCFIFI